MGPENLIKLTFDDAVQLHKKLVEKTIWLLRNSEIENYDLPANDISWYYSFLFKKDEILNNEELYNSILDMDLEERLKEELNHVIINFCMITPDLSIMIRLQEVPVIIEKIFRKTARQRMYMEKFFGTSIMKESSAYMKDDIWDKIIPIDELKNKLQIAIDNENYEDASEIQKQIDSRNEI
jgi:hypothetical protein